MIGVAARRQRHHGTILSQSSTRYRSQNIRQNPHATNARRVARSGLHGGPSTSTDKCRSRPQPLSAARRTPQLTTTTGRRVLPKRPLPSHSTNGPLHGPPQRKPLQRRQKETHGRGTMFLLQGERTSRQSMPEEAAATTSYGRTPKSRPGHRGT